MSTFVEWWIVNLLKRHMSYIILIVVSRVWQIDSLVYSSIRKYLQI